VRTLPQAPNLDYLKQQAKDLLDALREKNASARLSDAQTTLAQMYGFRTWSELKAEVERARTNPAIFDPKTAAAIADAFGLGSVTGPANHLETDVNGASVRLHTEQGTWHAHGVMDGMEEDHAEQAIRLMDAAGTAGIKTPQAMRTASGTLIANVDGTRWRVDTWIDLGPKIPSPVSSKIARKAGALLGTLHTLALEPTNGMHPWLAAKPRSADQWARIVGIVEEAGAPWAGALSAALPAILDVSAGHVEPPREDLILSHTDFQPPTTRLDRDDALVPTGWEFAGAISPAWHLGMVLDAWTATPDGELNDLAARAIVEGYATVTDVPRLDVSIFSPVISAWLNWLVSRMNIALGGEGDAQLNAEREVAHMLAQPKDRTRFERLLRMTGLRG
jgi:Ser/Thr protein kinase RdoA (MazF antagonist)